MGNQKVKDKYQERVKALAEKMAVVTFERFIAPSDRPEMGWAGLSDDDRKIWMDSEMDCARIAVAEMAVLAEKIFTGAYDGECLADVLRWNGLIPDNGQVFDPEKEAKTIAVSSQMFGGREARSDENI